MKNALTLAMAVLFAGCASSYRPIHTESLDYQKSGEGTEIEISYKHNVLAESDNLKYDQKARLNGVNVVAVKMKNNSGKPVNTRDLDFFVGGTQTIPANAKTALNPVRQRTGLYFLYLLMTPIMFTKTSIKCNNGYCNEDVSYFPIGLILGGGLTLLNAGMSSSANGGINAEIGGKDLYGKNLDPGQEAAGYLVFRDVGNAPISARLRSGASTPAPAAYPRTNASTEPDLSPADAKDFR